LPANDHGNTLHGMLVNINISYSICMQWCIMYIFWLNFLDEIAGGTKGFGDNVWTVESHEEDSHITFVYNSYDGEQGSYFI
jgi:hypothetical protein